MTLSEAEAALRCTAQTAVAALQKLQESELYTAVAKEPFVRRGQLYMSPSVFSRACLGESRKTRISLGFGWQQSFSSQKHAVLSRSTRSHKEIE